MAEKIWFEDPGLFVLMQFVTNYFKALRKMENCFVDK